ncbi:hypothetical protein UlMin_008694 [Ulmus minor]
MASDDHNNYDEELTLISTKSPLSDELVGEEGVCEELGKERNQIENCLSWRNKELIIEEIKKQLWLAGPLIAVSFLQKLIQVISLMFVGHLGELPLSGASMAISFVSSTSLSLMLGFASALDTLCGQSYGAKQYQMVGIHMQRAMFVLFLISIALAIITSNTKSILIAVGQDASIASEAGAYAIFMIPTIFAYAIFPCLNRFLQTQRLVFPMLVSCGFTTLIHIFICWVLVFKSSLGFRGAALANSISFWIYALLLAFYVKFSSSCEKTWSGFSREALCNFMTFFKLGVPSALMVCLEFWSFEAIVLLSGFLPNPKLETSVLSICLNMQTLIWRIPYGLGNAVSTRVSNELGAGKAKAAHLAVVVVLVMAIGEVILVGLVVVLIRNTCGYAYTKEIQVVKYVAAMSPILAISHILDGLQAVLSGIVRGCGWQKIGAYINLGSYYIVGIPSAILLAFYFHLGGKGLWFGIIGGLIIQVVSFLTITVCTNWELEVQKATRRIKNSKIQLVDEVSNEVETS